MKIALKPKSTHKLQPTDILFQTSFWSRVKNRLGWNVSAFDVSANGLIGDVLVLTRRLGDGAAIAYIPQGPEHGPAEENYGSFLEALSNSLSRFLDPSTVFIRYDLPWTDPYALDDNSVLRSRGRPDNRLREIRMNISTQRWNLKKAPYDLTVADSLVLDITGTEERILGRMKPKTRYNIRLSERRGVQVIEAGPAALPEFFDLYLQTAERNGFQSSDYRHFAALFETIESGKHSPRLSFYLAVHGRNVLAGAIVAVSEKRTTYLFGASSSYSRYLMGSYAVQWHAIKEARVRRCTSYDMGAVSTCEEPTHPFYGMYRFKTGFGGQIEHRAGSWDYPLHHEKYQGIRNREMLRSSLEY